MRHLHHCYQILEVAPNASFEEIHQSYKDLVMVWHPDRFVHNPRLYHKAQEKIKQLNGAYEQLRLKKTPVMASVHHEDYGWARSTPSEPGAYHESGFSQATREDYNRALDDYIRQHSRDLQNWLD
ncbi:J domain-containing protein [Roseofilum sp. BLCC_M91]|uniref:J domain-containing protein n=1 Tax=Roseofilum halophilum BLCC-M91 TaxID=3022259 RepID=A0ABT7BKH0_9CYAN|nr:J domain-containing protein [Roseofilum halophilum]MDJ1179074.1 J domain-containing protein [Roseofilum halophilum BLCC-M91]